MTNAYVTEAKSQQTPARMIKTAAAATQPIKGREKDMGANNNGGVSFLLDDWGVFERFLMIGVVGGTYSPSIKGVSTVKACFNIVAKLAKKDHVKLVDHIREISKSGRAPKNDPAIAALAIAASIPNSAEYAFGALRDVCRIGTHLFQFIAIYNEMGKWNALAKRSIAEWYNGRTPDKLAVQLLKYQSRNGWSHRDVLRLAHVKPTTDIHNLMYRHATSKNFTEGLPELYDVVRKLNTGDLSPTQVVSLIEQTPALSWEMIPTKYLSDLNVVQALIPNMGLTALIRKLGTFTSHGAFSSSVISKMAAEKIANAEQLHAQRLHPITIYGAFKQYKSGRGDKGDKVWYPDSRIVTALDDAFYMAFKPSTDSGENYLVGVDISGSMRGATVLGMPSVSADEVAIIMAMATVREQANSEIVGFNRDLVKMGFKANMSLESATKLYFKTNWNGGATDAGKLFEYALASKSDVDKFVVITDNDINSGKQPMPLLKAYRKKSGRNAKLAVIATSLSNFTIADPTDAGCIDIAGFDSAAPEIITNL